jgi:hypothetical protein
MPYHCNLHKISFWQNVVIKGFRFIEDIDFHLRLPGSHQLLLVEINFFFANV